MTSNPTQIRVTSEDPEPLKCVEKFWNYLSINDASCMDYFKSIYVDQMIILKFYDQAIRDKALALPDFETKLTGLFKDNNISADVDSVIEEINAAFIEEQDRLQRIAEANEID